MSSPSLAFGRPAEGENLTIERADPARPHNGKVLAAIQAHADDIPLFCGGTIAKLVAEGYTAYLIQTTNDEMCGPTASPGETVLSNERDVAALARVLGFERTFNFGYRNHFLDGTSPLELRCRLIFLFRLLRVDTIFTFIPWGEGETNPEHSFTAQAAMAAAWMAGGDKDYPEQFAAGLKPYAVRERYYWLARPQQHYNRVVDVSPHIETLIAALSANKSQGAGGSSGSQLKARLADRNLRLPELEAPDGSAETADRQFIRRFLLDRYHQLGAPHGLEYAEAFYYMGRNFEGEVADFAEAYAAKQAVPLA